MLNKRDKLIIKNIDRFRIMDRDSIAKLHFANLKEPEKAANNVLLRLVREGHIKRITNTKPFLYVSNTTQLKDNSQKIPHYLAILETYKEIIKTGVIQEFLIEPRYQKKGGVEPDIFLKYRDTNFFIEVQRTIYTEKQINDKIDRYINLYQSNIFEKFPHVLIITDKIYPLGNDLPFKVFQYASFSSFLHSLQPKKENIKLNTSNGVKMTI